MGRSRPRGVATFLVRVLRTAPSGERTIIHDGLAGTGPFPRDAAADALRTVDLRVGDEVQILSLGAHWFVTLI